MPMKKTPFPKKGKAASSSRKLMTLKRKYKQVRIKEKPTDKS